MNATLRVVTLMLWLSFTVAWEEEDSSSNATIRKLRGALPLSKEASQENSTGNISRLHHVDSNSEAIRKLGFLNKNCDAIRKKKKRKRCKKKQKKAPKNNNGGGTSGGRTGGSTAPGSGLPGNVQCGPRPPKPHPDDRRQLDSDDGEWIWLSEYCVWFKLIDPDKDDSKDNKNCNRDLSAPSTNIDGETNYFPCPVPRNERRNSGLNPAQTCEDSHECETGCCMPTGVISPFAIVNLCLYYEAHLFGQCLYKTQDETEGRTGAGGGGPAIGGGDTGGGTSQNPGGLFDGESCTNSSECLGDCCALVPGFAPEPVCVATFGFESDDCIRG